ncbi:hypothetical protein GCM10011506_20900 [Marivirga lumbricoides]|uniref:DUF6843 domain-containing protein n=1 Tax=Marivirga lumbricoides TaxID=1046115 RepID=A0ABQ1M9K8_9BACT|nr:hypothetical protein GCM10011506_20900 [Marivirga lumbricoides]
MKNLILTLILGCLFFSCVEDGEDSIRLIPKGYEGPVLIIFNQSEGEPKEYENGKRIYRVPESGVLKTQFESNYGLQKHQFFYVDSLGNREEIPFIIVQEQDSLSKVNDRTKVYAFGEGAIGNTKKYGSNEELLYETPPAKIFVINNLVDVEEALRKKGWFLNKLHSSEVQKIIRN